MYQRHLSEPLVPHAPRGFKQELVDPRYPEPGPPTSGLARPQTAFNHVTIKQEPRDFGYDSGMLPLPSVGTASEENVFMSVRVTGSLTISETLK